MPLQATSGAASYDAFGGGVAAVPNYIEECFSTTLYTGNGSTQTITNGIDLAGKGGAVWIKQRNAVNENAVYTTTLGAGKRLITNRTDSLDSLVPTDVTAFNSNGFSLGVGGVPNPSGGTMVSWTFREQPKFFDVVTYTGNGVSGRSIAHSLGSTPGCIIVKTTNADDNWAVYHRSLSSGHYMILNSTSGSISNSGVFTTTPPTSTDFIVGADNATNFSGRTYVAYLFAHNAGGFGTSGNDNVITCGSYTGNGGLNEINLGFEAQWVLVKSTGVENWMLYDNMRGMANNSTGSAQLFANLTNAEQSGLSRIYATATGFAMNTSSSQINTNGQAYIYIAIRRGPMKVPTTGTSVFVPVTHTTSGSPTTVSVGFPTDLSILKIRNISDGSRWVDRLRGITGATDSPEINSATTSAEYVTNDIYNAQQTTFTVGGVGTYSTVLWNFRRAPGFFDEVCYTGTGTNGPSITHNLGVKPEFVIVKRRSSTAYWAVGHGTSGLLFNLNSTAAGTNQTDTATTQDGYVWIDDGTTTTFKVINGATSGNAVNASGSTYVAYLFASCPGVSKVGSYTGTGTTQTINCGFTAGSRFVMIKRTDSTGDWYVWDSARGIVAGNDPYMLLNSTAAEVTSTDFVDTAATGFELSSTVPAALNASGGTYLFLAIA